MRFTYTVEVEVRRESGLFVGRDEIGEAIVGALESAESDVALDGLGANGDSEYSIESYSVQEAPR